MSSHHRNSTTLVTVRWVVMTASALGLAAATLLPAAALAQEVASKPVQQDFNREWFVDRAEQDAFMGALKQSAAGNPEMHGSVMLIHDLITEQPLGATSQGLGVMSS